jgi:hypothetical protein
MQLYNRYNKQSSLLAWVSLGQVKYGYCNNMDVLDVAKEIFGHACAAYYGVAAKAVVTSNAALLGGGDARAICAEIDAISEHGMNGIDLEDNKDTALRVMAYEACWTLGKLGFLGI